MQLNINGFEEKASYANNSVWPNGAAETFTSPLEYSADMT